MRLYAFAILLLLFPACTRQQLTNPGKEVDIVNALTPDQTAHYSDIGDVVVEQDWQFKNDVEDAKNQLRNYAARDGADLILLQSQDRVPCEVDARKRCLVLKGRKFRRADSGERPSEQL